MTTETPLDRFKAVLAGTARALADEPDVELAFTANAPVQSGKHLKVPMPARALPADLVAEYCQREFGKDLSESVVGKG